MNAWWALYLGSGVLVFAVLRFVSRRARLNVKTHDKIWTFWIWDPQGWIFGILLWPLLALASLVWGVAEILHRNTMRRAAKEEETRREELRSNPYRALPLDQLLSVVDTARKSESERK